MCSFGSSNYALLNSAWNKKHSSLLTGIISLNYCALLEAEKTLTKLLFNENTEIKLELHLFIFGYLNGLHHTVEREPRGSNEGGPVHIFKMHVFFFYLS